MYYYILIIIFLIFSYLIFQINNIKINKEEFANIPTNLSDLVVTEVNKIYQADVDAIKNLSLVAKGLTLSGGYIVQGGLTISGILNVANTQINNDLTVSGTINGINLNDMNNTINNLTTAATTILNNLNIQASQNVQNIVNSQASEVAASQVTASQVITNSQVAASQVIANSQAVVNSQASQVIASQNLLNSQVAYNKINTFKLTPNSTIDATKLILNVPTFYILGNGSFVSPQLAFTNDQVNAISLKANDAVAPTVVIDPTATAAVATTVATTATTATTAAAANITAAINTTNVGNHQRKLWNHNKGYRIDTTNLGLPFSTAYFNSSINNSIADLLINNAHYYFTVASCLNTTNCIRIIIDVNGNICLTLMPIANLSNNIL